MIGRNAEPLWRGLWLVACGAVALALSAGCQITEKKTEPIRTAQPAAGAAPSAGKPSIGTEAATPKEAKSCAPGAMPPVPPAQRKSGEKAAVQGTMTGTTKTAAPASPKPVERPPAPPAPPEAAPAPAASTPPKAPAPAPAPEAEPKPKAAPASPEVSTGAQGPSQPPQVRWDPTPQLPPPHRSQASDSAPPDSQPAGDGVPVLELSAREFDFGEVWQGAPAKKEFTVRNVGTAPLTLSLTTSCGCTAASRPKSPIEPNETTTFSLSYATTHPGTASKTATLTTNDPNQPSVVIPVRGTVKALFTATPSERITFEAADVDTRESHTIRLESRFEGPVKLALKPEQDFGRFDVELKEVETGKVYELTVTTKPPLQRGPNAAVIRMDTGLEQVPTYEVQAMAMVQPRIFTIPAQLFVTPATTQPMEQMLRVQYRADRPLKIVSVMSTHSEIRCELKDSPPPAPGMKTAFHQIRVTLPPYDALPNEGAKILISTDDPSPEFARLEVPVIKQGPPPAPGAATKGPQ